MRGRSPREKPPLSGEVAAKQAGRVQPVDGGIAKSRAGHARPLRTAVNGLRTRGARGAAARPFAVDGGCPGMGGHAKPVGIPQAANAASPL